MPDIRDAYNYYFMFIDEIQNYLNYIKSMGIQAWIPHSEGYGPKMSVADQCQSKILCLNYKGSDIYGAHKFLIFENHTSFLFYVMYLTAFSSGQ